MAPGFYLVRTLHQIYNVEELSMLKHEWIPISIAGFFFACWVIEGAYFDFMGDVSVQTSGIRDATLFASVSIFAIGTARFAETWGGYVRGLNVQKKMMAKAGPVEPSMEEKREVRPA